MPIWAKFVQKWFFVTFAFLTVDVSNKNDCKVEKIQKIVFREGFFEFSNDFSDIRIWDLCFDAFIFNTTLLYLLCVFSPHNENCNREGYLEPNRSCVIRSKKASDVAGFAKIVYNRNRFQHIKSNYLSVASESRKCKLMLLFKIYLLS